MATPLICAHGGTAGRCRAAFRLSRALTKQNIATMEGASSSSSSCETGRAAAYNHNAMILHPAARPKNALLFNINIGRAAFNAQYAG